MTNTEKYPLIARPADGKVYQRVAKKQNVPAVCGRLTISEPLYHWCRTPVPERLSNDTPPHVCDIWEQLDQEPPPPPPDTDTEDPRTIRPVRLHSEIRELIQRVNFTQEEMILSPVPLLKRVEVLAYLYQAAFLDRIADALEFIADNLPEEWTEDVEQQPPENEDEEEGDEEDEESPISPEEDEEDDDKEDDDEANEL